MSQLLAIRDDVLAGFRFYYYDPSMAAAVIFIILFLLTTGLHCYQMVGTKTWFMIPFFIGGIFETIGYVGRAVSSSQSPDWTLGPFVIQSILLLVAPALLAASIYMCLGRIVLLVNGESKLFIRRTWLTKTFVCGDILSFLLQAGGGGLMAGASSTMIDIGQKLVLAGLAMQVLFFGMFVLAGVLFHVRMRRLPTAAARSQPWEKHMLSLYIVSLLIFVRSIVRVTEYAQGFTGYILKHEVYLYCFDATVMFIAMVTMNWIHPSEVGALLRGGRMVRNMVRFQDVKGQQGDSWALGRGDRDERFSKNPSEQERELA